jgi:hypothetical protein
LTTDREQGRGQVRAEERRHQGRGQVRAEERRHQGREGTFAQRHWQPPSTTDGVYAGGTHL